MNKNYIFNHPNKQLYVNSFLYKIVLKIKIKNFYKE